MNGFGVGAAVAVGIEIGTRIICPEANLTYVLMMMVLYGAFIGYVFEIWRIALKGARLPSLATGGRRSSAVVIRFLRAILLRGRSP